MFNFSYKLSLGISVYNVNLMVIVIKYFGCVVWISSFWNYYSLEWNVILDVLFLINFSISFLPLRTNFPFIPQKIQCHYFFMKPFKWYRAQHDRIKKSKKKEERIYFPKPKKERTVEDAPCNRITFVINTPKFSDS